MTTSKIGSLWNRIEPTILIIATVLIPITLWLTNVWAEKERTKLEYVRIAVAILQPPPEGTGKTNDHLRGWAVDVLAKSSPVLLPEAAKEDLVRGRTTLPKDIWFNPRLVRKVPTEPGFQNLPYDPDTQQPSIEQ